MQRSMQGMTRARLVRLLLAPLVLVGLTMIIVPLAGATQHGSSIPPYAAVFSKNGKTLKVLALGAGAKLDVVWKGGECSNGYATPPVVATWSGPTVSGGRTTGAAAPTLGPCLADRMNGGTLDFRCDLIDKPPYVVCVWTWSPGNPSTGATSRVANPERSEGANVFLYKRTARYAFLMKPGAKAWTKTSVPVGTNEVHWYGPHGG